MTFKIKIEQEAHQDIQEGIDWYNQQQPGLGRKFGSITDGVGKQSSCPIAAGPQNICSKNQIGKSAKVQRTEILPQIDLIFRCAAP
jgi:hypothetical protein